MVFTETVLVILISTLGIKRSYRLSLLGERYLRNQILKSGESFMEARNSFQRQLLRKVFESGVHIYRNRQLNLRNPIAGKGPVSMIKRIPPSICLKKK
ncbi:hypothetical protein NDN08_006558 [Rhodosorus marinus]|uniref:Uncharacterized protein n=1 Tax=Rhodosorus marinus TaxID=101924 RepID=A0AAV8UHZ2_9RHOD|nr:hypothetical protein NDN08_006558 [Rhodosorus marinus]